jgi:hypothetical protein
MAVGVVTNLHGVTVGIDVHEQLNRCMQTQPCGLPLRACEQQ